MRVVGDSGSARALWHRIEAINALITDNRGWSSDDVDAATSRLEARGLLDAGAITERGQRLRSEVEGATDRQAMAPIACDLDTDAQDALLRTLDPASSAIVASGMLPFPNPMGLPKSG
ncbi:MAG: hypothetical protein AAF567_23365 [Actinomycetota bacterium]